MTLLLTGFGPFPGVERNPTELLVQSLNGMRCGEVTVHSVVLPVTYEGAVAETLSWAAKLDPVAVLGTGVAVRRERVCVESTGRRQLGERPDALGACAPVLVGPEEIQSRWDVDAFATLVGGQRSDDAGDYVCNAWLYGVQQRLALPVGFLHIPGAGMEPAVLAEALSVWFSKVRRVL